MHNSVIIGLEQTVFLLLYEQIVEPTGSS